MNWLTSSGSNWIPAWRRSSSRARSSAHRGPVWSARDHRLVGVGDGDDPRPDRDLLAGEPVRVAAAVVPLVVVEHDRRRVAQRAGLLEDDLADLGVLGDDPPLRLVELARLGEDLVRDRELAQVVEQARRPDPVDLAGRAGPGSWPPRPAHSAIIVDGPPAQPGRAPRAAPRELVAAVEGHPPDLDRVLAGARRDRGPPDLAVVLDRAEDVDLVAPEGLGRVEGRIGVTDERIEPDVRAEPAGDAGAQGDADGRPVVEADLVACRRARRTFSAIEAAASTSVSGRTIMNSSPPYRPTSRPAGRCAGSSARSGRGRGRRPRDRSVSLKRLKWSMSIIAIEQLVTVAARPLDLLIQPRAGAPGGWRPRSGSPGSRSVQVCSIRAARCSKLSRSRGSRTSRPTLSSAGSAPVAQSLGQPGDPAHLASVDGRREAGGACEGADQEQGNQSADSLEARWKFEERYVQQVLSPVQSPCGPAALG